MKSYKVQLKEEYSFLQGGTLECMIVEPTLDELKEPFKRPAVIVVPGGAYRMVSKREGQPVALNFLSRGFQAFILDYLCGGEAGYHYPEQLFELSSAVDYIKKHADELMVNADEIFVVGFSAGGHLTANLAVDYRNVSQKAGVALDCKPTAVGLGYPVISAEGHQASLDNLLYGYTDEAKEELLKTLALDTQVDDKTAPAFIWTTAQDGAVKPSVAMRYAIALAENKVPYELHVYPLGGHGKSSGDLEISFPDDSLRKIYGWEDDCAEFFRLFTKKKFKN